MSLGNNFWLLVNTPRFSCQLTPRLADFLVPRRSSAVGSEKSGDSSWILHQVAPRDRGSTPFGNLGEAISYFGKLEVILRTPCQDIIFPTRYNVERESETNQDKSSEAWNWNGTFCYFWSSFRNENVAIVKLESLHQATSMNFITWIEHADRNWSH